MGSWGPQLDHRRTVTAPDAGLCCTDREKASVSQESTKWPPNVFTKNRLQMMSGPAAGKEPCMSAPWVNA